MEPYNPGVDDFGRRLREVRETRGLNQTEVARRAVAGEADGPNPKSFSNYLSKVENERETNPSLDFLEKAARGMGLTLSEFFAQIEGLKAQPPIGTDQPPPKPDGGGSLPAHGVDFTQAAAITAIAEVFAERFDRAIDRLVESRQQTSTPRRGTSVRAAGGRKVRG